MYIYIYHVSLSLSLSLSLEAVMMLVIVLVECEIWGIVERVRFTWRGDPDGLFVSRSQNWQPFVAAMAMRVPFLCLIRALSEPPPSKPLDLDPQLSFFILFLFGYRENEGKIY
jgi:hypothetical protein